MSEQTETTLALAYEQRTANLIAARAQFIETGEDSQAAELWTIIEGRLGLNGGTND